MALIIRLFTDTHGFILDMVNGAGAWSYLILLRPSPPALSRRS